MVLALQGRSLCPAGVECAGSRYSDCLVSPRSGGFYEIRTKNRVLLAIFQAARARGALSAFMFLNGFTVI